MGTQTNLPLSNSWSHLSPSLATSRLPYLYLYPGTMNTQSRALHHLGAVRGSTEMHRTYPGLVLGFPGKAQSISLNHRPVVATQAEPWTLMERGLEGVGRLVGDGSASRGSIPMAHSLPMVHLYSPVSCPSQVLLPHYQAQDRMTQTASQASERLPGLGGLPQSG